MQSHRIPKGTRRIPLTNGGFALVDAADYSRVMQHSWHWVSSGRRRYIAAYVRDESGKRRRVYLHQFIMGEVPDGMCIDHISGCGCCNYKVNLRVCTPIENFTNSFIVGRSGLMGVTWNPRSGKWQAMARGVYLGLFHDKEEAGRARDRWMRENLAADQLRFARFNFDVVTGERLVHGCEVDHELPEHQPHVKSVRFRGVSLVATTADGQRICAVDFMNNGERIRLRYRDEVQGAREYDELRVQHGLERVNFPGVTPVLVVLSVSYGVKVAA